MSSKPETLCPSAPPDWEGARLFAVAVGTPDRPSNAYLDQVQPVTRELLDLAAPAEPTEVFRFAAPCAERSCGHYDGTAHKCRLVEKTVRWIPGVVEKLPRCAIRVSCRWWQQEGRAACQRCPQVVTVNYAAGENSRRAADPRAAAESSEMDAEVTSALRRALGN